MKLQSLEYFVELAQCGSLNKAAQTLYVAQPSLTKAIQLMEKELNLQLFVRTKTGMRLTPAGEQILPQARQMVETYHSWLALSKRQPLRQLDIYIHASFANFLLPEVILEIKKQYPDLNINCETTFSPETNLSQSVRTPVLALLPCTGASKLQQLTEKQGNPPLVLMRGEYGCLLSRESPLAGRASLTVADLAQQILVLPTSPYHGKDSDSLASGLVGSIISAASLSRVIRVESVESVIKLVQKHPDAYALSFWPALTRYEAVLRGELVFIPFSDRNTKGDLCLFYCTQAARQYPELQAFLDAVAAAAAQFPA